MAGFDVSFSDGGWGHESSFSTEPFAKKDSEMSRVADKLPIPVRIATLAELEDEKVNYGEMSFASALTIGDVKETKDDGNTKQYVLADPENPSATFTVVLYEVVSMDSFDTPSPVFDNGTRVFAAGKLRSFDGKVTMTLYRMRALDAPLEYDCFLKEAEIARLFWSKGIPQLLQRGDGASLEGCAAGPPAPKVAPAGAAPTTQSFTTGMPTPTRQQSSVHHPAAPTTPAAAAATNGAGGSIKSRILGILEAERDAHPGENERKDMHIKSILVALRESNMTTVKAVIDDLQSDGLIYSTIDDDHFELV